MIPYYIILGILILFSLLDIIHLSPKIRIAFICPVFLGLVCFAAFRMNNPDWGAYCDIYQDASKGEFMETGDAGFGLLAFLLSRVSRFPVLMFLAVSFLSVWLNIKFLSKCTPYMFTCLLLYFVHNYVLKDMIQIRAGLASAICLYSLTFLPSENYRKAVLIWLLAVTVHISSVVFGLTFIVNRFNFQSRVLLSGVVICLFIGSVYPFGQVIKSVVGIGDYEGRIADYVAYGNGGYAAELGIWSNINTIKCLIVFGGLLLFWDKLCRYSPYFKPVFYAYFTGLCWVLCFNDFSIVGARISNILTSGEPVLLTMPFCLLARNTRPFYLLALVLLAISMFQFNISPDKVVPYQFYFSSRL